MDSAKVERVYKEATGKSLSYKEIMDQIRVLSFFLKEAKMESNQLFKDLNKRVHKFIDFLAELKETDLGR